MSDMTTNGATSSNGGSDVIGTAVKKTMGKDDYLKLLVTEMQYQNPLEPMDNKDTVAQLAQFSALEQTQNLATSMNSFISQQKDFQDEMYQLLSHITVTSQASGMIGKDIKAKVNDKEVSGTVDGFKVSNGSVVLMIGSQEVPLENVYQVSAPKAADSTEGGSSSGGQ